MVLDKKRCWKQVVETAQIINVLEGRKTGWANHPAVKMWVGHVDLLKVYFDSFLLIAKEKHGINTKYEYYEKTKVSWSLNKLKKKYELPWWLRNKKFHRAMRARLIEKDESFYLSKFPKDKGFNDSKYFWPVMDGSKTFKII